MRKSHYPFILAVAAAVAGNLPAHAQDIGGIIGGMMGAAIRAEQQRQYFEQQRRAHDAQIRAQRESERAALRAEKAHQADLKRQEAARLAEQKRMEKERQEAEKQKAIKQAKLEKVLPAARQLVQEGSSFLQANPGLARMLDYAEMINNLNKAEGEGDPEVIERRTVELSTELRKEPAFAEYSARVAEERRKRNAQYLTDAIKLAESQKQFLMQRIATNPTGASSVTFVPFVKELAAALTNPDLDQLTTLTGRIDLTIRQTGYAPQFQETFAKALVQVTAKSGEARQLTASATSSAAEAKPAESPSSLDTSQAKAQVRSPESLTLASTEKNKFLLEGDLKDVVFAYNTSANAPHVLKNLRGDIVFDSGQADVCFYGPESDKDLEFLTRAWMSRFELKRLNFGAKPCDGERLSAYDVIVARRGSFLSVEPRYALAFIKEIELDNYKELTTLSAASIKQQTDADAARSTEIQADIAKGTRDGFGFLRLSSESSVLCSVTKSDGEGHRRVLLSQADNLSVATKMNLTVSAMSLDGAFANAKRGQCGVIYSGSGDLKELTEGFDRDEVKYQILPIWVAPDEIKSAQKAAETEKAVAEQQALDRQRRAEEERRLASMRAADVASTKAAQQAELRATFEKPATATAADIADEVKEFFAKNQPEIPKKYPNFVNWYRQELSNRWELMKTNSELLDYGLADWKGRSVEAAFTRVELRLRNRMLGDYQDACFVFGQINDKEFSVTRDHFEASCDDADAFLQWKRGHQFASRWFVE